MNQEHKDVDFTYLTRCECGAISVTIAGKDYSMSDETFTKRYGIEIGAQWINCNHCINHWGIDLCGCGSGEQFNECGEGLDECGTPMQSIEKGLDECKGSW